MAFENRRAVGRRLAEELRAYAGGDAVVVGVTRGGMAAAHEVARTLHLPLDTLVVHRIPEPGQPHLPLSVVAEPDHLVVDRRRMRALELTPSWLEDAVRHGVREVNHHAHRRLACDVPPDRRHRQPGDAWRRHGHRRSPAAPGASRS